MIDRTLAILVGALSLAMVLFIWLGWRRLRTAQRIPFFTLRRERSGQGWRLIVLGFALGLFGLVTRLFGQQAAHVLITPTPSVTPTPSATFTPTVTLTPSITPTASITPIPPPATATPTPQIPEGLTVLFRETVTPRPEAVFSEIAVSRQLDNLNRAIFAAERFELPVDTLYGAFTYDFLDDGVRWTAIWLLDGEIICSETKPWDGGTGGYGFTECLPLGGWALGDYEIQMFLGNDWNTSARFSIGLVQPTPAP